MPIAAPLIIGGASIASGVIGANAAKSAADAQVNAENNALAFQQQVFNTNQDNLKSAQANFTPYLNIGKGATYSLGQLYGIGQDGTSTPANADYSAFTNSPDYAFAQQQGELGLTRAENARGLNLSGGALKDIAQFNQGLASQQFGNYFNRLLSLSQLGSGAASASGNVAVGASNSNANMANSIGNTMGNIGQSQASGIIGGANAITGSINNGITNSLLYNAINRSSYSPPGASAITQGFGNIGGTGGFLGGLY